MGGAVFRRRSALAYLPKMKWGEIQRVSPHSVKCFRPHYLRSAHLAGGVPLALGFALGDRIFAVAQVAAGATVVFLTCIGDVHRAAAGLLRLGLGLHRLLGGPVGVVLLAVNCFVGTHLHVVFRVGLEP